jgi:hypothetical protein
MVLRVWGVPDLDGMVRTTNDSGHSIPWSTSDALDAELPLHEHDMTSTSFDFRVYLKNIFALEPPLKLATFVVKEVIYKNVKKTVKTISPRLL